MWRGLSSLLSREFRNGSVPDVSALRQRSRVHAERKAEMTLGSAGLTARATSAIAKLQRFGIGSNIPEHDFGFALLTFPLTRTSSPFGSKFTPIPSENDA
jgi:hypothetical protein